jgi:hypothetical protein
MSIGPAGSRGKQIRFASVEPLAAATAQQHPQSEHDERQPTGRGQEIRT